VRSRPATSVDALSRATPSPARAELVASVLKVGGLLDANCNPGAATPEMLHRIYMPRAAVSANPCLLREINGTAGATSGALTNGFIGNLSPGERLAEREALLPPYMRSHAQLAGQSGSIAAALPAAARPSMAFQPARRRADSPPRGHLHAVNSDYLSIGLVRGAAQSGSRSGACSSRCVTNGGIQLTMDSLKMGGRCKVHPR
jgi:hypothetical protein